MGLQKLNKIKLSSTVVGVMLLFLSNSLFAQEATKAADTTSIFKSVTFYGLMFLLVCLFIAIVGASLKIFDLSKKARGLKDSGVNWNKLMASMFIVALVVGLYGVYWEYAHHGAQILPEAASVHGIEYDMMFKVTMIITTFVFIVTHIMLFVFSYQYQHKDNHKAYYYPHNNTLEFAWTIVPAVVLTVLVVMGFLLWRKIFHNPAKNPIVVEVTAEQFLWTIRYPGKDGKIGEKNYKLISPNNVIGINFQDQTALDDTNPDEMVLPVNKPVRLVLGAKDVIHSFYAPHFRVQMNCVPGMPTYFEFTPNKTTEEMRKIMNNPKFDFLFYCSKICGGGHYNMQKKIRIVSEAEYQKWLTEQPLFLSDENRKEFHLPMNAAPTPTEAPATDSTKTAMLNTVSKVAVN